MTDSMGMVETGSGAGVPGAETGVGTGTVVPGVGVPGAGDCCFSSGETHWGHTFVFRPLVTHRQIKHLRRENLRLATVAALLAFTTLDETKLWPYAHPSQVSPGVTKCFELTRRREAAKGVALFFDMPTAFFASSRLRVPSSPSDYSGRFVENLRKF